MSRSRPAWAVVLLTLGLAALATAALAPVLWSVAPVRAVQSLGSGFKVPMEVITFFGSEEFFVLLVPLIFWCINKPLGMDLGVLLVLAASIGLTIKAFLKHPRPFWEDAGLRLASGASFSLPSGHALNATVLLGYLAVSLVAERRWRGGRAVGILALVLLIPLVGISRIYLGVHFPGDLLWGWAIGIAVVTVYMWVKPHVEPWLRARALWAHVLLAVLTAAAMLALTLLLLSAPVGNGSAYPERYAVAREQALSESASVAAMILGFWIGLVLEGRYVRFAVDGPLSKRIFRYLFGVAGLAAIWLGLPLFLPTEPLAVALLWRIVRYSAAVLWAVAVWPWLFVKLGLATRLPADSG